MSLPEATQTPVSNIARVAIKPPPFWKINPTLWFAQLEAQFSIAGITVDDTKFHHVVSAIETDVLNSVSDIILNPPQQEKYSALKNRLIELHSESQESKIRTLLQGLELGDQRPSQLLTRMRSLAGEAAGEPLLKSLWLSRLPATSQSILAALSDDLSKLATVADKISEFTCPSQISVAGNSNIGNPSLEQQIAQLSQQVNELTTLVHKGRAQHRHQNVPHRGRRSHSRNRSSNKYKEASNNMCFYHTNFGSRARKCIPPCSFNAGN